MSSSMFTRFWGSQEEEQEPPQQSRTSHVSSPVAAGVSAALKEKSVDELQKISSDKDAYQRFLQSLEQVKIQNNLKDELCKENMLLVDENLQKEPRILELKNQCRIIRTTELAAAQEKLKELEKQKEEILKLSSTPFLLHNIQEAINKTEEESEDLHQKLLDKEIDLGAFLQQYKKLRIAYHSKSLIHLAARTSNI
ncbi:hypothetical protein PIB30_025674 [Stylosanthes scabra]|uniref:VPS37 C-terminal domain-containing protein n=1 Tax=Stylosanthes scabra TaxID=79078 RepID=A0ABU6W9Q0_9FABA|nr:hypothetical protein [Stylosanthes scabra]